jgi:GAF domain-containing protein
VLVDIEFLAVADRPALTRAVLVAALTLADACDLQLLDYHHRLNISAHHGFDASFLNFFATVESTDATACAHTLRTGLPILVDDVARHPIFAGHPTRDALLDAGSGAVASYPLHALNGTTFGVLSHLGDNLRPRISTVDIAVSDLVAQVTARTGKRVVSN